jgi:succinate dehydrogenase flavin-adding protein (antitoxin of CptAB toxin-antitoxin module)
MENYAPFAELKVGESPGSMRIWDDKRGCLNMDLILK